jgi:hypothetical protein
MGWQQAIFASRPAKALAGKLFAVRRAIRWVGMPLFRFAAKASGTWRR